MNKVEELEQAIAANDEYLQKVKDENKRLKAECSEHNQAVIDAMAVGNQMCEQREELITQLRASHAELLAALINLAELTEEDHKGWPEHDAACVAIANAEKLK